VAVGRHSPRAAVRLEHGAAQGIEPLLVITFIIYH
jgi:hypothetical protein